MGSKRDIIDEAAARRRVSDEPSWGRSSPRQPAVYDRATVSDEPSWGRSVGGNYLAVDSESFQTNPRGVEALIVLTGLLGHHGFRRTLVGSKQHHLLQPVVFTEFQTNPRGVEAEIRPE